MRAVIFSSYDLEPITVVELSREAVNFIRETGGIYLTARPEIPLVPAPDYMPTVERIWTVRLRAIPFVAGNRQETFILVTDDDETALLLKSVFLAGQRGALQQAERTAYEKGVLRGFLEWGR